MTNCLITPLLIELQVHVYLKLMYYSLDNKICMSMKVLSFLGATYLVTGLYGTVKVQEGEAMPKSVEWL